jgi:hypothetical protein
MPSTPDKLQRCSLQFNYKLTTAGVPQPYPVASPNTKIVFRYSPAEDENGRIQTVLNICGTREGLKYLAAMLVLCAESEKYDPEFHIHLENMKEVEADMDVTIRAPNHLDALSKGDFSESKGTPIAISQQNSGLRNTESNRLSSRLRPRKPKAGRKT